MAKDPKRVRTKRGGLQNLSGSAMHTWPTSIAGPHPDPVGWYTENRQPDNVWKFIADTHGFLQDDFNPCYHERYVGVHQFPFAISWTASDGPHTWSTSYRRQLKDPIESCRSIQLPLGSWLEDFSARAEYHFITLVDTDYSLLNFIAEAIGLLSGNVSLLERLKNSIETAISQFRRKFAETGSYWLSWNFAIKPTLRDIKKAMNIYKRAHKRLAWLKARNHKDTKVHYREGPRFFEDVHVFDMRPDKVNPIRHTPPVDPNNPHEAWLDWLDLLERTDAEYKAKLTLTAWAWIRFDIPDEYLEGLPGLGIVLSAMQGLYNPLAVAWEAVPFSWLIDWCRTEAHKLEELVKSDINPLGHATIKATGWTSHVDIVGLYKYRNGMTCTPNHYNHDVPPSDDEWTSTDAGGFRYRLYNRQPGLPKLGGSPFRIPWEWYNASILSALIQQKRRR